MDDLDHTMHIAECDWTSFCEESEECSLLQPSLACPDNSSLSDSEDSETSSPVFSTVQQVTQQNTGAESNAARCSTEGGSCIALLAQLSKSDTGGEQDDVTAAPKEESVKTAEDTGETNDNITNRFQLCVQMSGMSQELKEEDRYQHTESDNSRDEPNPGFPKQAEVSLNEPHATEGAASASSAVSRAEKERWFVTVNDGPARPRVPSSSVKKKRRQKRPSKNTSYSRHEKPIEKRFEIKRNKNEFEGGRDTGGFIQSSPDLVQNTELNPECVSESSQMCCQEDKVSGRFERRRSLKEYGIKPMMCRIKQEPGTSASMSHDTLTPSYPSQVESIDTDELDDGVEFCSVHSCDSESYLSAAESVEEPQPLKARLTENHQLPTQVNHPLNTADTQDRQIHLYDSTLCCKMSPTNCDGCESTNVESTLTFPSAGQRANKMPDDISTCDNDTHSVELCRPSDTPRFQKHERHVSASGSSSGDQLRPFPVPDLSATPRSVADSPETYAQAAGHTKSVYAISAFWDEMEKLTIRDILQLRVGRSTPPAELQETVTTYVDDSPLNHSSPVDTTGNPPSAVALMETSDTADSDYFTQPDESKQDFEFSTSDFEEEYWQLIGTSRNHSPDPRGKNQQRASDSPFSSHEESSSTCSEGKETPVPLEDFVEQCFQDQESHSWPGQMTKSKTVHNIQALNTEDSSLKSSFGKDETRNFLSSCEEESVLKVNDDLETPALSSTDVLDEDYQTSIPEVSEYFFTEDKVRSGFRCVTVYNPKDISVVPVFDCCLCPFRDQTSFSFLHDYQHCEVKPIPIFSCSHPTVRELAFPKPDYVFFNDDCKEEDISLIRLVSQSFTQATDCGAAGSYSLLSIRKIHFHNKGSICCRRSVACFKIKDPPISALTEKRVSATPIQLFGEQAVPQRILGTIHTRREGVFSTLKQSDMCLVCIAFASWVLRSSDPEAADAWKAALLANVSALSAIRFLRQYVKKNPPQDDP